MIIPITINYSPNGKGAMPQALADIGTSELALIELQGELEVEGEKPGQVVGKLSIDEGGKGKPTLRIGYHLLEGKVVSLSKPLAVLHRKRSSPLQNNDSEDADAMEPSKGSVSYSIEAIVRKKIVFSKRPMPIVGLK